MIEGLRPYPEYRKTGVPWLPEVPSHWSIRPAKRVFREVDDRSTTGDEELLSVSHLTGVTPRRDKTVTMFMAESYVGHKVCRPGDLVVNTMWAWAGALGVARLKGLVSPAYGVYRPLSRAPILPAYADLLLRNHYIVHEYNALSTGIQASRLRLYPEQFLRIALPCPPLEEQAAIVRFIDHADRLIWRCIGAKSRLLRLLQEQKDHVVNQAITRGIKGSVLRPSGAAWLGDVPEDWTIRRFKSVVQVATGQVDPQAPEHRLKILIAPNHIKSGAGKVHREETAEQQGAVSGKYQVRRGQVVYSKIRPNLRKATIARSDCICSADMYPLVARYDQLRPEFLLLLLLSAPFTRYAVDCSLRAAMPKVNRETLGEALLWYPSLPEQDEILRVVRESTAPVDAAMGQAEREIALLREYRTRLTAEVVSGEIDVRRVSALLAAQVESSELTLGTEHDDDDVSYDDQADGMEEDTTP